MADEETGIETPRPRGRPRKEPQEDAGIWVKCVCENKPWSGGAPLEYWQDYQIDPDEALILSERKQVVILKLPEGA